MRFQSGSLHVLWEDIAEIRALAIHPDYQHLGLGSKIVEYMKKDAKQIGIHRLFTFMVYISSDSLYPGVMRLSIPLQQPNVATMTALMV